MATNTVNKMTEYGQQALDFLAATNTSFEITYSHTGPHFAGEKDHRDIYRFTLKNSKGEYSSTFGDSFQNTARRYIRVNGPRNDLALSRKAGASLRDKSLDGTREAQLAAAKLWEKPSAYDVLACLTKYDPGTFDDFCADFGYSDQPLADYPKVMGIYQAVLDEYRALRRMFSSDELDRLAEIN